MIQALQAPARILTSALLSGGLAQGIAIVTRHAALAVVALRVAQAFQTPAGDVVADPHRVQVHVAVALASPAGPRWAGLAQGVAIVTIFALLTAHPCSERGKK